MNIQNILTGTIVDYTVCESTDTYTEITIQIGENVHIALDTTHAEFDDEVYTDQNIQASGIDNIRYAVQAYPDLGYPILHATAESITDAEQELE